MNTGPRIPPHSVEAEQAVLGGVLLDNGAWGSVSALVASDWYRTDHKHIYAAMARNIEEGRPCDALTVAEALDQDGHLDAAGGLAYLSDLTANTPSSANITAYATIVRERAARRALIGEAAKLQDAAYVPNGRSTQALISDFSDAADGIAGGLSADGPRTALVSMADLLAGDDEETEWLAEGLLPAGGLSLILGKPKAGKSTLARGLCMAVARGSDWLGRTCAEGPVVYVALEEKRAEVRRHFLSLGATDDTPIFSHVDRLPESRSPVEWLRETVAHVSPALIVIDPLGRFVRLRDGGNDYTDATRQLEPLISYARDSLARTHIAFVHHSRKSAGEHGDESLGSTAILGSVDTALSLQREKGDTRMLYSVNRYGQDLPKSFVSLDPDTGWVTLGGTKAEASTKDLEDAILDFVAGSEEQPVPHRVILDAEDVRGARAKVLRTLGSLVNAGRLQRTGSATRGDPFKYSVLHSSPI